MKPLAIKNHITYYAIFLLLPVIGCKDPSSGGSPVISQEAWTLTVPGTENSADLNLYLHENSSLSCNGNWYFSFYGNDINCNIMTGTVTKDTSYYVLNCTGTASYPPDENGDVESSGFTLVLNGQFKSGVCSGGWEINFTDTVWDAWAPAPGVFTGELESGSGVTD